MTESTPSGIGSRPVGRALLVEGCSYVALLMASALKRVTGDGDLVSVLGPVHGMAFIAAVLLIIGGRRTQGWSVGRTAGLVFSAVIPGLALVEGWRIVRRATAAERTRPVVGLPATPDQPGALEAVSITKEYPRTTVGPLSFSLPVGTVTGLIGPNGAGKTTAIRMLLGLVRLDAGSVQVLGTSLANEPRRALEKVGALVEGPGLYPGLTGRANLRIHAALAGVEVTAIDRSLERVDLTDVADAAVHTYSLGMRQRLALAAALLTDPAVLILDEPANGLDPHGIADLHLLLRGLAQEGKACLISSHQLEDLGHVCDRLVAINDGVVVFNGAVEQMRSKARASLRVRPESPSDLHQVAAVIEGLGAEVQHEDDWLRVLGPGDALPDPATVNRRAFDAGLLLAEISVSVPDITSAYFGVIGQHVDPVSVPTRPAVTAP